MEAFATTRSVLIAVVLGLISTTPAPAQTVVGGSILEDTTWTHSDSPFRVVADVEVGNGATLTIEPGVVIEFDLGRVLAVGPSSLGPATLVARGMLLEPIRFVPSAPAPRAGQWVGLHLLDLTIDATVDPGTGAYLGGTILEHAVVEFAGGTPDPFDAAVLIRDCTPMVRDVEVSVSESGGVAAVLQPGQSITLERVEARECLGIGIRVEGGREHALIDLTTRNNRSGGLCIEDTPRPSILGFQSTSDEGVGALYIERSAEVEVVDATVRGAFIDGVRAVDAPNISITRLHALESRQTGLSLQGNCEDARIADGTFELNQRGLELLDRSGAAPHNTTIETTTFSENIASGNGGAMVIHGVNGVLIDRCDFAGNESDSVGGALVVAECSGLRIESSRFNANASAEWAGALALMDGAEARIIDTAFENNATFAFGGAVFVDATAGGIDLGHDPATGAANRFIGNDAGLGSDVFNGLPFDPDGSGDVDATCVDWGTTDPAEVRDRVWDFEDDPSLGRVLVLPLGPCPPTCRPDLDGDGSLTIFDFLIFFNLFDVGDLAADFDGDGVLTIFDFLGFQNEFDAGCG